MRVLNLTVCASLWAITFWRAPGAVRKKEKRALWAAFLVLAVEMCFADDSAGLWLDRTVGINCFSALLKHTSAVTAAAFVLVFLSRAAASSTASTRPAGRLRAGIFVPAATCVTVIAFFALADRPHEAVDLLTTYPRDPWVLAYTLTWTAYFGWAMFTAAKLSLQWSRRPGPALLRRGLRLICAGTTIGIGYAVHRTSMLVFGRLDIHPLAAETESALNALLALVPLLLISTGSTLPMYPKASGAVRQYFSLLRLYPLWDHLTEAVPHARYDRRRHLFHDALDLRGVRGRLYRRTIEIRDAILVLNGAAPVSMRLHAADHVENAAPAGTAAGLAAEACWLRAAREAQIAGLARSGDLEAPTHSGADLEAEVALLLALSDAYFSDLATTFAQARLERLTALTGATS
ncbi:MAB_1171c family putative transporter [Kitasatospora griseola]|uniref:MAB_1171c family putative transporter n=1 Tax=Kitasatospora griseola TaxID=2064 RepID=UPI003433A531